MSIVRWLLLNGIIVILDNSIKERAWISSHNKWLMSLLIWMMRHDQVWCNRAYDRRSKSFVLRLFIKSTKIYSINLFPTDRSSCMLLLMILQLWFTTNLLLWEIVLWREKMRLRRIDPVSTLGQSLIVQDLIRDGFHNNHSAGWDHKRHLWPWLRRFIILWLLQKVISSSDIRFTHTLMQQHYSNRLGNQRIYQML